MRLTLTDGSTRVGGYYGTHNGQLLLADELSGEVHEIDQQRIERFDVMKYSALPTR